MNITWNNVLLFGAGALVGALATAKIFKTKYERIAQEEIDSVKRAFFEAPTPESTDSEVSNEPDPETVETCNDIINECGYNTTNAEKYSIRKEAKGVCKPYVISPSEFDTVDGYEAYSLTYYADGVLTDEQDIPIEDVDSMVGKESLTHYGEYEEDAVHVRNPALKCDFEILRDLNNYSDVYRNGPRPNDD